ncbi:hypothetical protein J6590_049503 [Homalodisca vitripennis]|nr:hypothetical protein J6590_049503 [Homalodisca vitripennis]
MDKAFRETYLPGVLILITHIEQRPSVKTCEKIAEQTMHGELGQGTAKSNIDNKALSSSTPFTSLCRYNNMPNLRRFAKLSIL